MQTQDFEKYALVKPMNGEVAHIYRHYFQKWIGEGARDLKLLDFGCGDGKYFHYFSKIVPSENIFGVEISKIRVDRCRDNGWANVFHIEKLKPLPFPGGYFDFINFDNVIEHISQSDIDFYLSEFIRILRKNGKVIICTPNYPIKILYDLFYAFSEHDFKRLRGDPTHITRYNFKKLRRLLSRYFATVQLEPTGGPFYKIFNKRIFSHKIIGLCIKK